MQLTYLPNGAQDANRQTSGVLLFQAALRANCAPAYRTASLLPREKKNDGGGLHLLHQARAMPEIVHKLLINKVKTVDTCVKPTF